MRLRSLYTGRLRQVVLFAVVTATVLSAGVAHRLLAQRDYSAVEIEVQHVAGNIYMLKGAGGNIGVSAGADGLLMVDDQFAPLADKIRAALAGLKKGDLELVLNTHWHGDHTGGNAIFGAEVPVIAHTNVRLRMSTVQETAFGVVEPAAEEALPVLTYNDGVTLHLNGEAVEVVHFPTGHTDGDSIVFFTGSGVVHMGDDMFAGMFPFVDLASGGSVTGARDAVAAVLERVPAGTRFIPGHGPVSSVEDLQEYHGMLTATIDIVEKQIAAGKSLEEIQAEGLPEQWDAWGKGFIKTDRWLATIHQSLTAGA